MPLEFLRGLIGLIGVGCAFMCGSAFLSVRRGQSKPARLTGWLIRMTLCLAAVAFRHPLDTADIIVAVLALAALSAGIWEASRTKKTEDLTRTIFPDNQ